MSEQDDLTDKQALFVLEYLVDLNATQAAIRAGYSELSAKTQAYQMLQRPKIRERLKAAMDARSERTKVTADMVVLELRALAFSRMNKFTSWGPGGVVLLSNDGLSEDETACVAEVSESTSKEGGSLRFKLHDKIRALELLGRHLGIFEKDNSQKAQPVETYPSMTKEQAIEALEKKKNAV